MLHQIGQLPRAFGLCEANNSLGAALRGCDEQRGITPCTPFPILSRIFAGVMLTVGVAIAGLDLNSAPG